MLNTRAVSDMHRLLSRLGPHFGLLLILAVALGGLFFLFELFFRSTASGPSDLLAISPSEGRTLGLPNILIPVAVCLLVAGITMGVVAALFRARSRRVLIAVGPVAGGLLAAGVLFIMSAELEQMGAEGRHNVDLGALDPLWLVTLGGLFLSVTLVAILKPRWLPHFLLLCALLWFLRGFPGLSGLPALDLFEEGSVLQARSGLTEAASSGEAEAEQTGALDDAGSPDALTEGLADEDAGIRQAAARALGEFGGAKALRALIEALADVDPEVRRAAADALTGMADAGIKLLELENGGSMVTQGPNGASLVASATTAQAARRSQSGQSETPVFEVSGAAHTGYLRTAVGDAYENGLWRQLDPAQLDYPRLASVPDLVRSFIASPPADSAFALKGRLNPALLALPVAPPARSHSDTITVRPGPVFREIPAGRVPTSRYLASVSQEGILMPFSATFSISKAVPGYAWLSGIPDYSGAQLDAATPSSDRTYTQLPADLPSRVRELALKITASASTPYQKAKAIETYLRATYPYRFADLDSDADRLPPGQDPVDWFLFDHKKGTCGNFSSAFVILARSIGLPARVVSGWAISQAADSQVVYADQAHQWAEVPFSDLGWVRFEPTPGGAPSRAASRREAVATPSAVATPVSRLETQPTPTPRPTAIPAPTKTPQPTQTQRAAASPTGLDEPTSRGTPAGLRTTLTGITEMPERARKGYLITVQGTVVTDDDRQPVDGMRVEIFLNEEKAPGGRLVGTGWTTAGRFEVAFRVPTDLAVGSYQALAHAVASHEYEESWSDPDIGVYAGTHIELTGPTEIPVDVEAVFTGRLSEEAGAVIAGQRVEARVDSSPLTTLETDSDGAFSLSYTFHEPGQHLVEVEFAENDHFLGNLARLEVAVAVPTKLALDTPGQVEVGESFPVGGTLRTSRGDSLPRRPLHLVMDGNTIAHIDTDEQGGFQTSLIIRELGPHMVEVQFEGDGPLVPSSAGRVVEGWHTTFLEIDGPREVRRGETGAFTGRFTVGPGSPVEMASLLVHEVGSDVAATVTTRTDGTFEFQEAFSQAGPVTVVVTHQAGDFLWPSSAAISLRVVEGTLLTVDGPSRADVGQPFTISGALRVSGGGPVPGQPVTIGLDEGERFALTTDSEGRFSWQVSIDQERVAIIGVRFEGAPGLASSQAFLPVTAGNASSWLGRMLWVVLPVLVTAAAAVGFLVGRRFMFRLLPDHVRAALVSVAPSEMASPESEAGLGPSAPPAPPAITTHLEIRFLKKAEDLPDVWGVGEEVQAQCQLLDQNEQGVAGAAVEVRFAERDAPTPRTTDASGRCAASWTADTPGTYQAYARFDGGRDCRASSSRRGFRVVEFREEVVRLYNLLLEWAREKVDGISDEATPREVELTMVRSGIRVDERALGEIVDRFEEADYSEHEIGRRHYEAAYRAWRDVTEG